MGEVGEVLEGQLNSLARGESTLNLVLKYLIALPCLG
jgi:hypothetical protein